jgi:predicted GIY-YIG superfamily endonuclease
MVRGVGPRSDPGSATHRAHPLDQRVCQHKTKAVGRFTAAYGVGQLVSFEAPGNAARAIQREQQLKKWRRAWALGCQEQFQRRRLM